MFRKQENLFNEIQRNLIYVSKVSLKYLYYKYQDSHRDNL